MTLLSNELSRDAANIAPVPFAAAAATDAALTASFQAKPQISLSDAANIMSLTDEQRHAFFVAGKLLLRQLLKTTLATDAMAALLGEGPRDNAARLARSGAQCTYIGGSAGCGKSRVVDTLTRFASWGVAHAVCVAPLCSLHRTLGLRMYNTGDVMTTTTTLAALLAPPSGQRSVWRP